MRRGPGRAGAFTGDSERSTSWEGYVLQAGSAPSEALALSVTLSKSWDVFDYDFGAGPKFPRVSPSALIDAACAARSRSGNVVQHRRRRHVAADRRAADVGRGQPRQAGEKRQRPDGVSRAASLMRALLREKHDG